MAALRDSELREHMQSYLGQNFGEAAGNIIEFRTYPESPTDDSCSILQLIDDAAETIAQTNRYAAERLSHADSLAKRAVEQLQAAEKRVAVAEAARAEAEASFTELCERTDREYKIKLEELQTVKDDALARVARAETRMDDAEKRATAAEKRIQAVELTFKRIEVAVTKKLLTQARQSVTNQALKRI
jgi:chromosome segregation ATPase